jgi:integrase
LADGTLVRYWYAWKGGPRLIGQPGDPEFLASYNQAVRQRIVSPHRTLLTLMQQYQASTNFTGLGERTKRDYVRMIKVIEQEYGDFPLKHLPDPRTRAEFMEWRDRIASSYPRKAEYIWRVLSLIVSWGKDRGHVTANPFQGGGTVYHGSRVDEIWSDAEEAQFLLRAGEYRMELPYLLGAWTGQREGDILSLPWSAYDGQFIRLKQKKTGASLIIPVGEPLKRALDATKRESPIMLTNTLGKPWLDAAFQKAFRAARERAGIDKNRKFQDLRGTAVTRLAGQGVSVPEIAALTGHSLRNVHRILQAHYLHLDVSMAQRAVRALEKRTKTPNWHG